MHARGAVGSAFPTTRWTRIVEAQQTPTLRRELLGELLQAYWRPLFVLARRSGLSREAAEDAVQGLWLRLLEHDALGRLDRERGSLRGFLCAALRNFIASDLERAGAQKRGAGRVVASADFDAAESALGQAPLAPDAAYEREWALTVVQQALALLRAEFESGARRGTYELALEVFGFGEERPYRELAQARGMSVTQLKAFAFRARGRFQVIVETLVADTVPAQGDLPAEVQKVWGALGS